MNQKKCPKCGEMNPPEAVMCWACYTPLTGTAAVAPPVAGGRSVAPAASKDEKEKPKIPVWQLGVIGAAVVGGLIYGGMMMFGGSPAPEMPTDPLGNTPKFNPPGRPVSNPPVNVNVTGGPLGTGGNSGGGGPVEKPSVSYTTVVLPSTRYDEGTMAILSNDPSVSPQQAQLQAKFARAGMTNASRWAKLHIFVFSDSATAQTFATYQIRRGNQPLTSSDYAELSSNVWPKTPVHLIYINGRQFGRPDQPAQRPNNWWTTMSKP